MNSFKLSLNEIYVLSINQNDITYVVNDDGNLSQKKLLLSTSDDDSPYDNPKLFDVSVSPSAASFRDKKYESEKCRIFSSRQGADIIIVPNENIRNDVGGVTITFSGEKLSIKHPDNYIADNHGASSEINPQIGKFHRI